MHINYHRGETRELTWRHNSWPHYGRHYGKHWRRAVTDFKLVRATCDLEEPRYRRKRDKGRKPFALVDDFYRRRYATLRAAEAASLQRQKQGWWWKRQREELLQEWKQARVA